MSARASSRLLFSLSCALAPLLTPISAFADEGAPEDDEIVVTAQRREQSVQSTPLAVTALSAEMLEDHGVQTLNDLVGIVPGFAVRDAGQSLQYNLRGYISTDGRANADGPVAVYIDDVFLGATVMQQMQSLDVSRVEALRGPQGTLFGRNAVGGLIHFISNTPDDEFGGYARLQLGDFDERIAEGAINVPINERLAVRAALKYNYNDGWQQNLMGGRNRSSIDAIAGRIQVEARLTDTLEANFSFQADHERNQYQGYTSLGAMNAAGTAVCAYDAIVAGDCFLGGAPFSNVPPGTPSLASYDPRHIYSTLDSNPDNYDAQLAIGRFDWDVSPNLTLSSITSWAYGERSFIEDDNATGIAANDFFNLLQHDYDGSQISQEFRAAGSTEGGTEYVLGLYYLDSEKNDLYAFLTPDASAIMLYAYPLERIDTQTVAVFGQGEFPLTDDLHLIAGGRYTWEEKESRRINQAGVELPASSGDVSRFTGRLGLQWTPSSDLLFYGHASTGFKSGEFPSVGTNAPLEMVDPETIAAFEIGMKSDLFDNMLRLNLAAYFNQIEDKQSVTTIQIGGVQQPYFVNFGEVEQRGVEAELTFVPNDDLVLSAMVAYADNEVHPEAGITVQRLANFQAFSLEGNELPGAPPFMASVNGDWTLPVGLPGDLVVGVTWRYQSKTYWNLSNNEVEVQPAFDVGDVRLTYTSPDDRWSIGAFVNNVTDTKYENVNFSFGGSDVLTIQWARPRWAGVRASVNF